MSRTSKKTQNYSAVPPYIKEMKNLVEEVGQRRVKLEATSKYDVHAKRNAELHNVLDVIAEDAENVKLLEMKRTVRNAMQNAWKKQPLHLRYAKRNRQKENCRNISLNSIASRIRQDTLKPSEAKDLSSGKDPAKVREILERKLNTKYFPCAIPLTPPSRTRPSELPVELVEIESLSDEMDYHVDKSQMTEDNIKFLICKDNLQVQALPSVNIESCNKLNVTSTNVKSAHEKGSNASSDFVSQENIQELRDSSADHIDKKNVSQSHDLETMKAEIISYLLPKLTPKILKEVEVQVETENKLVPEVNHQDKTIQVQCEHTNAEMVHRQTETVDKVLENNFTQTVTIPIHNESTREDITHSSGISVSSPVKSVRKDSTLNQSELLKLYQKWFPHHDMAVQTTSLFLEAEVVSVGTGSCMVIDRKDMNVQTSLTPSVEMPTKDFSDLPISEGEFLLNFRQLLEDDSFNYLKKFKKKKDTDSLRDLNKAHVQKKVTFWSYNTEDNAVMQEVNDGDSELENTLNEEIPELNHDAKSLEKFQANVNYSLDSFEAVSKRKVSQDKNVFLESSSSEGEVNTALNRKTSASSDKNHKQRWFILQDLSQKSSSSEGEISDSSAIITKTKLKSSFRDQKSSSRNEDAQKRVQFSKTVLLSPGELSSCFDKLTLSEGEVTK